MRGLNTGCLGDKRTGSPGVCMEKLKKEKLPSIGKRIGTTNPDSLPLKSLYPTFINILIISIRIFCLSNTIKIYSLSTNRVNSIVP